LAQGRELRALPLAALLRECAHRFHRGGDILTQLVGGLAAHGDANAFELAAGQAIALGVIDDDLMDAADERPDSLTQVELSFGAMLLFVPPERGEVLDESSPVAIGDWQSAVAGLAGMRRAVGGMMCPLLELRAHHVLFP